MNHETVSSMEFCEPTTICLAETSLLTPEASHFVKEQSGTPSPEDKKPAKKRKSWGQELPTPKTNLPPRKRAKTEDEKEQRRIERVLRNRQAAQSSRERKRQEVEKLEGERDVINQQNHILRQRLLQVEEEKFKLRQQVAEMSALLKKQGGGAIATPSATPSPILAPEKFEPSKIKQELEELNLLCQPPRSFTSSNTQSSFVSTPPDSPEGRGDCCCLLGYGTTSCRDVVWPAVPTRGSSMSSTDSALASRRNSIVSATTCHTAALSDAAFDRLFCGSESPMPAPSFFEEGLAAQDPNGPADAFHLDSLVDFDAIPSTPTETDSFDQDKHHDPYPLDFFSLNDTVVDFSHQSAATSSVLQPCIGASS